MTLTKERVGEIAFMILQSEMFDRGVCLDSKQIKRKIKDLAKKLGIPTHELSDFFKVITSAVYEKTMATLNTMAEKPKTNKV